MNQTIVSPEMLLAREEARADYAVVIARKNELAVEAASLAIEVANSIGKGIGDARAYSFRAGSGYRQWNITGLPLSGVLSETEGTESISSFTVSAKQPLLSKNRELIGVSGHSLERVEDKPVWNAFELSTNNTAYHPKFGRPYIDFMPIDVDMCGEDPEILKQSYVEAGRKQIDSAHYIIELITSLPDRLATISI